MDGGPPTRRRPRPVADAPPCDGIDVTKAWLVALVADAPLHRAASVPAGELARGGPAFCSALLDALRSDEALARFTADDGGRLPLAALAGRLSGARTPAAIAAAVETLRGATWAVLVRELRDPPAPLVGDLADRLAHVCSLAASASLAHGPSEPAGRDGPLADALRSDAATPPADAGSPLDRAAAPPTDAGSPLDRAAAPPADAVPTDAAAGDPSEAASPPDPVALPPSSHLSLVDEGKEGREAPPDGAHVVGPPPHEPVPDAVRPSRFALPRDFDGELGLPTPPPGSTPVPPPGGPGAATVTRVPRPERWAGEATGEPPWRAAIGRRLERRAVDGLPFAVLAVEVDDLDRLLASETGREVAFALEIAERGLTAELAPADLVVRERLGRWWLTSPDRDADAARDLGARVADAIAGAVLGGAPLRASIGIAVCPDDGDEVDTLATRADVGVFSARSGGVPLG